MSWAYAHRGTAEPAVEWVLDCSPARCSRAAVEMQSGAHGGTRPAARGSRYEHSPTRSHAEAIARLLPARGGSGSRPVITPAGRAALVAQIAALRAEHATEVAERLRDARGFGEPAGNDEYWALLEDDAVLAARIARLERLLSLAVVVGDEPAGDGATVGDTVAVRDAATRRVHRYTLVDARHGWAPSRASIGSPVGLALIGRPVGARVAVQLPGGRARELEVVAVERVQRAEAA